MSSFITLRSLASPPSPRGLPEPLPIWCHIAAHQQTGFYVVNGSGYHIVNYIQEIIPKSSPNSLKIRRVSPVLASNVENKKKWRKADLDVFSGAECKRTRGSGEIFGCSHQQRWRAGLSGAIWAYGGMARRSRILPDYCRSRSRTRRKCKYP